MARNRCSFVDEYSEFAERLTTESGFWFELNSEEVRYYACP